MLDLKLIRENPEKVEEAARNKGIELDVSHLLEIDEKKRELEVSVQKLREERNRFARLQSPRGKASGGQAKEKNIDKGKEIKGKLEKEEKALRAVSEELNQWLYKIPNIPKDDVRAGKDESENEELKKIGKPNKFDFKPKDHLELGKNLGLIDVESAAVVSGTRFAYLKNESVLLEFALVDFALKTLLKENFIPVIVPELIKTEVMGKLGYMENGEEDMFHLEKDGLTLIGTAEHSMVPLHLGETFDKKTLPKRYVGFSSSFRREAGSYGKDTRGIFRVHQFDKVEMVSFVPQQDDDKEHEFLLSLEEKLWNMLEIPYRVVKMCTGDLGFPTARKYDLEAWIPSQQKYREVTSVSTTTDFQARRLNIRYSDGNEKKFVHILNGTAFAIGRTLAAIFENYQEEDGSVFVPKVLQEFLGKEKISPKTKIPS